MAKDKFKPTQRDIFTRPERQLLFESVDSIEMWLFLRLGFFGGLRLSEILTVRYIDFLRNDGKPVIHIRESKGGKSRHACIDSVTRILARIYCGIKGITEKETILGRGDIKTDSRLWQRRFKSLVEKAGITRIEPTPHTLRHTNITWLLESGMPIEKVSKHAGHADISTTMIYEHLTYKALANEYHNLVGE